MILIADSGSTKTDWCVVEKGELVQQIFTKGTNPFFQSEEEISNEIATALLPELKADEFDAIYFYGAGCGFPDKIAIVRSALTKHLKVKGELEVANDMLAAARGLCGRESGIACIMGTGSNSCVYDGQNIVANVSPLGFILGDEGSGAVLGKLLMGNLFKNQLPDVVKTDFEQTYGLSMMDVIEKVYRQPLPNRFLASFGPFISKHIAVPQVYNMVYDALESFIVRNIKQYPYQELPVNFTGSIAFYFADILHDLASKHLFSIGCIQKDPLQGLVEFHLKDN
jgi:N-acetylglucosamine kinase-like BadF-type ATPase